MRSRVLRFLMLVFVVFIVGACGNGNMLSQYGDNTSSIIKENTSKTKKNKKNIGEYVFFYKENDGSYYMNINDNIETKYYDYYANNIWLDTKREQIIFTHGEKICIKKLNSNEDYYIVDSGKIINIVNDNYILFTKGIISRYLCSYDLNGNKINRIYTGNLLETNNEYSDITYFQDEASLLQESLYIKNNILTFVGCGQSAKDNLKLISYDLVSNIRKETELNLTLRMIISKRDRIKTGYNECVYLRSIDESDNHRTVYLCKVVIGKNEEIIDTISSEAHEYYKARTKKNTKAYLNIGFTYADGVIAYSKDAEWTGMKESKSNEGKPIWTVRKERYIIDCNGNKKNVSSYELKKEFDTQRYTNPIKYGIILYKEDKKNKFIFNNKEYDGNPKAVAKDYSRILCNGKSNEGDYIIDLKNNEITELGYYASQVYIFDKNHLLTVSDSKVNESEYGIDSIYWNSRWKEPFSQYFNVNEDCSKILYNANNGLNMYDNGAIKTFTPNIDGYALTNNFNLYYGKKDGGLFIYINDEEVELSDAKVYINTYEIIKD